MLENCRVRSFQFEVPAKTKRLVPPCVCGGHTRPVSSRPCRSHRGNTEAKPMVLKVDLVSMVTSDGHRQWQQWEGRSLSMRHYNNKGNLEVNRRTSHLNNNNVNGHFFVTQTHAQHPSASLSKKLMYVIIICIILVLLL